MERAGQGNGEGQAGGYGERKGGSKGIDVGLALPDNLAYQPPFIPFEMQAGRGREGL